MRKTTDDTIATLDLTQSQLLLWMGQRLNPTSPMYNMAIAFELEGNIEEGAFQKAFRSLVQQSDAMRIVFTEVAGTPKQVIKSQLNYDMEVLDFSEMENKELRLKDWKKKKSQRIFDISECLFESVLIKMEEKRYVWFFNQHHLITDAWATTLLYKAMSSLYEKVLNGAADLDLSIPKFQDYVHQLNFQCNEKSHQKAEAHWSEKAKQLPERPVFYNRSNTDLNSHSIRVSVNLGQERSDKLRALTQEPDLRAWTQHLSLFNAFSTILFTYLYRITGQQKLTIGTPAHNRSTLVLKETPGVFIELFPLTTEVKDSIETFNALLQKVKVETNDYLRYAQPNTSTSDLNRSFNVVLNYINAAFTKFNGIPMKSEWIHSDYADAGHHLRLQVHDFDASGSIELCFDMNTAVFDEKQRELTPTYFIHLLDAFIEERHQSLGKPALTRVLHPLAKPVDANNIQKEQEIIIRKFEQEAINQSKEKAAIRYGDAALTYGELEEHANKLANYLIENGVAKNDRVAILLSRSPEFVIAVLAVMKAGAAFVPIPTNYPSGRMLGIVEDAQPKVVLSNSVLSPKLRGKVSNIIQLDKEAAFINSQSASIPQLTILPEDTAYLMYTSGSTGLPKGVMINHQSLAHYIQWAKQNYCSDLKPVMPLFTSVGFDLTITSLFLPLVNGGTIVCFPEAEEGPDLSLFEVMENDQINIIKLTPSHLNLLKGKTFNQSALKTMIVGGENLKTELAAFAQKNIGKELKIFNEYGPTEATVGCVVHQYDSEKDAKETSVPIGRAIANTSLYILDEFQNIVPEGTPGELHVGGICLAKGYWNQQELTDEKFIKTPFTEGERLYRTGDLVRLHTKGYLEYLGREDLQVKIRGRRIELEGIESVLNQHPKIKQGVVELRERRKASYTDDVHNCTECGLPSNYPNSSFDDNGVCNLCQHFTAYQEKVKKYFKTEKDLEKLLFGIPSEEKGDYDCLALLSGGKDSTYVLAQLVELGLKPLTFTLDNGYISEEAKENIRRVVGDLGVDHVFGETDKMDAIFVDSLERHCNVCDGCFKTIYTLSVQIALEKKIPFIITGLSRGQFFETRLTEELFRKDDVDIEKIDEAILNARKAYHQVDDAVKELLDTSMFADESVFEKIQFVDYYRYTDVSLDEMLEYLDQKLSWVRPSDTGRSTNCLINQAGIYVHKKERGYSNYAFPYSWDVRIGHKTRDASLEEINEEIDVEEVQKILDDIGYTAAKSADRADEQLVAYYLSDEELSNQELRTYLLNHFPDYMVPVQFIRLEELPMTVNGKIDRDTLPEPDRIRPVLEIEYVEPQTEFEELVRDVWSEVMQIDKIGIHDNFLDIGGDSLSGIRVVSRLNEALELELPVNIIFQKTTIATLAAFIEDKIRTLMELLE